MIVEFLALLVALAAAATWMVLLPLRAFGRLGPRRGRLHAKPSVRPAPAAPTLPKLPSGPQPALVVGAAPLEMSLEKSVEVPAKASAEGPAGRSVAALVGAGHR